MRNNFDEYGPPGRFKYVWSIMVPNHKALDLKMYGGGVTGVWLLKPLELLPTLTLDHYSPLDNMHYPI